MMTLTNWYSPSSDINTFSENPAAMWVKIVSSWLVLNFNSKGYFIEGSKGIRQWPINNLHLQYI